MVAIQLTPGADVRSEIIKLMKNRGWKNASVVSGFGSLKRAVVRNPADLSVPPGIVQSELEGPLEIVSFVGHVQYGLESAMFTRDNWYFHFHIAASKEGGEVRGGGFESGQVHISMRILVEPEE